MFNFNLKKDNVALAIKMLQSPLQLESVTMVNRLSRWHVVVISV